MMGEAAVAGKKDISIADFDYMVTNSTSLPKLNSLFNARFTGG